MKDTYMIKPFDDVVNYQAYWIDNEDYLDLLDPHIGEDMAMKLGTKNIPVSKFWKPLDVTLFQNEGTVDIPDISEWNRMLCMNEKAFNILNKYLEPYGEFLPCNVLGKNGYLFHCLNFREFKESEVQYEMYEGDYDQVISVSFPEDFNDHIVMGKTEVNSNLYFSNELGRVIKIEGLKGLILSDDISLQLPY